MEPVPVCLNGSLADLVIQDVLQILALGRKTGHLLLETPAGAGVLVLRKGRVVASIDDGPLPASGVSRSKRDALIRERVVAFVHRLARCRRGEFSFEPSPHAPRSIPGRDLAEDALHSGIDVIDLLIEIACRQDGEGLERTQAGPGLGSRDVA